MLVIWRCVDFNLQEIWNCFWEREIHGHHAYVQCTYAVLKPVFWLAENCNRHFYIPRISISKKNVVCTWPFELDPLKDKLHFCPSGLLILPDGCCCYFLLLHFYWHILSCALLNMKFVSALWDKWSKIPFSSCSKVF